MFFWQLTQHCKWWWPLLTMSPSPWRFIVSKSHLERKGWKMAAPDRFWTFSWSSIWKVGDFCLSSLSLEVYRGSMSWWKDLDVVIALAFLHLLRRIPSNFNLLQAHWRWSNTGIFSSKSAYCTLLAGACEFKGSKHVCDLNMFFLKKTTVFFIFQVLKGYWKPRRNCYKLFLNLNSPWHCISWCNISMVHFAK